MTLCGWYLSRSHGRPDAPMRRLIGFNIIPRQSGVIRLANALLALPDHVTADTAYDGDA
jgi:hypothetical protein